MCEGVNAEENDNNYSSRFYLVDASNNIIPRSQMFPVNDCYSSDKLQATCTITYTPIVSGNITLIGACNNEFVITMIDDNPCMSLGVTRIA